MLHTKTVMSLLPLSTMPIVIPSPAEYVDLIDQLNASPVTVAHIREWILHDKTLSRVQRYVLAGWPTNDPVTQEYSRFRDELSMCDPVTFYVSGIRPRLLHLSPIITVCSEYTLTVITLCRVADIIWLLIWHWHFPIYGNNCAQERMRKRECGLSYFPA